MKMRILWRQTVTRYKRSNGDQRLRTAVNEENAAGGPVVDAPMHRPHGVLVDLLARELHNAVR